MKKLILSLVIFGLFISTPALCPINSILERAITLSKWKYYDDAIVELNRIIPDGKEPWTSRAEFLKGWCLLKKEDYKSAEDVFTRLSQDQNFALWDYSKFYLGETYYAQKKWQMALDEYKGIFYDSALRPDSVIKRAQCLEQMGDINMAIETYKALIAEGSPIAPLDKARLGLGKCYEKVGNPQAAMKMYHEVNLYHPLSPSVKEALSRIAPISRKYKIYPNEASAEDLFNKAMVYYNYGDFGSAGMFFNKIVTGYKNSDLWEDAQFKAAMCDYKRRRVSSSILKFKSIVARGGTNAPAAQFYIAFAYGKSGYFYQALESLNKVINNYPDSSYADDAYYYLGYYYEVNGFKDSALSVYEKFADKYPKSEFAAECYWRAGRLHYFKKDFLNAYENFKRAVDNCESGPMLDACAYWKGLVLEKLNSEAGAIDAFSYVASRFDHTYYGYRAKEKLLALGHPVAQEDMASDDLLIGDSTYADTPFSEEPLPFEPGVEEPSISYDENGTKNVDVKDHFKKYTELMAVGFYDQAANEATMLVQNSSDDKKTSARLALATAQLASGKVRESIAFAEVICNNSVISGTFRDLPKNTWCLAYPKGYYSIVKQYANQFGIDEALVLAVIREESRFNTKTTSWANARGLMQIIPPTGRVVAYQAGIRDYRTGRLHEPEMNIKMGCYYLAQLLKQFNGNKYLAVAAYNGGPARVAKWMKRWQVEISPDVDMDEFLEAIPLSETRRYVQKVMKSYFEYKRIYTSKYPLLNTKG
jgi:soluble lytic murein transglycosylase